MTLSARAFACLSILVLAAAGTASAGTLATTHYDYYDISGQSAVEIYDAMLRRGPHVDGDKAYAATSATSSQQGKLVTGKSCRISDYTVKIDFVIRLPRLKNAASLTAGERQRFQTFAAFLRRHEETHRSIWLDCAAKLEARIAALHGPSCSEVEHRSTQMWDDMRKACSLRHQAFDAAEQKRLLQHPFVRFVLEHRSKDSRAAAAP